MRHRSTTQESDARQHLSAASRSSRALRAQRRAQRDRARATPTPTAGGFAAVYGNIPADQVEFLSTPRAHQERRRVAARRSADLGDARARREVECLDCIPAVAPLLYDANARTREIAAWWLRRRIFGVFGPGEVYEQTLTTLQSDADPGGAPTRRTRSASSSLRRASTAVRAGARTTATRACAPRPPGLGRLNDDGAGALGTGARRRRRAREARRARARPARSTRSRGIAAASPRSTATRAPRCAAAPSRAPRRAAREGRRRRRRRARARTTPTRTCAAAACHALGTFARRERARRARRHSRRTTRTRSCATRRRSRFAGCERRGRTMSVHAPRAFAGALDCSRAAVALASLSRACTTKEPQPSTYFDRTISPILTTSCVRTNTGAGCHVADAKGNAFGNLDLAIFAGVDQRRDLLARLRPVRAAGAAREERAAVPGRGAGSTTARKIRRSRPTSSTPAARSSIRPRARTRRCGAGSRTAPPRTTPASAAAILPHGRARRRRPGGAGLRSDDGPEPPGLRDVPQTA